MTAAVAVNMANDAIAAAMRIRLTRKDGAMPNRFHPLSAENLPLRYRLAM